MKLILLDDDGQVLDTTEISRGDWGHAQRNALDALSLVQELNAGRS